MLKALHQGDPAVFKEIPQDKRVIGLDIPYGASKVMYVINTPYEIEGVTGSNVTNGRK